MAIATGLGLALIVGLLARLAGLDRDRALYPVIMIVIASYYCLFAVISNDSQAIYLECGIAGLFLAASIIGFKTSLWFLVGALCAHGLFDLVHGHLVDNRGVPTWWPAFCAAYDMVAAAILTWLLWQNKIQARSRRQV
jgi:hypothetical protein